MNCVACNRAADMHPRWADREARREAHLAQMRAELRLAHHFSLAGDYEWADLCGDLAVLSLEQAIRSDRA